MSDRHFDRQLRTLDDRVAEMAGLVDQALDLAIAGLLQPYVEVRERARELESRVDALDSAVEEASQALMALQSPVAADLRRLITTMRMAVVLENIGDEAERLAKRARYLARHNAPPLPQPLADLAAAVLATYRQAVPVLRTGDCAAGRSVMRLEAETDRLTKVAYKAVGAAMKTDLERLGEYSHLLRAIGRLENAADLSLQLVEEAVFLHHGVSIRHNHDALPDHPGRGPG
jgi:phosphate transport system protein